MSKIKIIYALTHSGKVCAGPFFQSKTAAKNWALKNADTTSECDGRDEGMFIIEVWEFGKEEPEGYYEYDFVEDEKGNREIVDCYGS
jgi:hypothetical protein